MIPPVIVIRDPATRRRAQQVIAELPDGDAWDVRISKHRAKRSIAQNRLAFLWYGEIQQHIFDSTEQLYSTWELHEFFVKKLMPCNIVEINGVKEEIRQESKRWDVATFTEYLKRLEFYCKENLNLQLSHSEDVYYQALSSKGRN